MAVIGSISINISAATAALGKGLHKSSQMLSRFAGGVAAAGAKALLFGTALATGAAAGLALLTKRAFAAIDATAKLADRLGFTTRELAGLHLQAQLGGSSAEAFNKGLAFMTKTLGEAAARGGPVQDMLRSIGLDAEQLANMRPGDAYRAISDAIASIENPAERARAAYLLFGRSGIDLVNVLDQGAAGMEAAMLEAERLGASFSRVDAAKIEAANDSVTRLKVFLQGVGNQIAIQLAPVVTALTEKLIGAATSGTTMGEKIAAAVRMGVKVVGFFIDVWDAAKFGVFILMRTVGQLGSFVPRTITRILEAASHLPDWLGGGLATDAAAAMNRILAANDAALDHIQSKIDDLVNQPPASERMLRGFDEILRSAERSAEAVAANAEAMGDFQNALAKVSEEQERLNELTKQAASVYERTRTPLERYDSTISELSELLEKGLIDWDTYTRAVRMAREELESKTRVEVERDRGPGRFETFDANEIDTRGFALLQDADSTDRKMDEQTAVLRRIDDGVQALARMPVA